MKVLVTGANGLLGNNLVRELLAEGHTVRAMVRKTSNVQGLEGLDAERVYGDVRDVKALTEAARGCEVVYHTAAVFAYWGYARDAMMATAREGGRNVVDAAHEAGVRRVVLTSSASVWGKHEGRTPIHEESPARLEGTPDYFVSKALQEETALARAEELGVELVAVCPSIFMGPYDFKPSTSLGTLTDFLNDPMRLTWTGGGNIIHVQDVAQAHILLAEQGVPGERYLACADNLEWTTLHETMAQLAGLSGPRMTMSPRMARWGSVAMEAAAKLTGKPPLGTRDQAALVGHYFWYDGSKLANLGFAPRSTRKTLAQTLAWYLESPHISPKLKASLTPHAEVVCWRGTFD